MKNFKTLSLIMLSILAFSSLHAQKKTDKKKIKEYQLKYEFTGEVSSNLDSTFLVYCVFDKKEFKKIKKIKIKSGEEYSKLKEVFIESNDSKKIKKKGKKVYVEVGKSDENTEIIEVYTADDSGELIQSNLKTINP
jgi:hypothetical protein